MGFISGDYCDPLHWNHQLKDLMDFREILSKIKCFSEISGLYINKDKTHAMCLGENTAYGNEQFGIKFVESLRILGVYFDRACSAIDNPKNKQFCL